MREPGPKSDYFSVPLFSLYCSAAAQYSAYPWIGFCINGSEVVRVRRHAGQGRGIEKRSKQKSSAGKVQARQWHASGCLPAKDRNGYGDVREPLVVRRTVIGVRCCELLYGREREARWD